MTAIAIERSFAQKTIVIVVYLRHVLTHVVIVAEQKYMYDKCAADFAIREDCGWMDPRFPRRRREGVTDSVTCQGWIKELI